MCPINSLLFEKAAAQVLEFQHQKPFGTNQTNTNQMIENGTWHQFNLEGKYFAAAINSNRRSLCTIGLTGG
ncbi:MAG: hypothetical protein COA47_16080 [Robiginitomaculum sp.]|nr:MAG: hypothetical protein COA47_16080 [Robiginitomaculum sp.]